MRLRWTDKALEQFSNAIDYIAEENPASAQLVAQRVADATQLLLSAPGIGRTGRIPNTREWVVRKTSYIIVYNVEGDELWILRLIASKQDPDKLLEH